MIEKQPYTGDYSLDKVYTSDWRVIRERLLGPDYIQISGYKGCWSEAPMWVHIKREIKILQRLSNDE